MTENGWFLDESGTGSPRCTGVTAVKQVVVVDDDVVCQSHRIVTPPTCVICIWLAVVELDCVSHVLCISVSVATNHPATCMADSSFELFIVFFSSLYGDGAGNTVEENYSIFSLIRMR